MTALKPCPVPWCKSTESPKVLTVWGSHQFTVRCLSCKDIFRCGDTEVEAIEQWNHRPFEAHAVEVLFKYISRHHEMTEEKEKAMRTEARQLLGWEE